MNSTFPALILPHYGLMRFRRRSFGLQITVLCIAATVAVARYWYNVGFDQKYRTLIADELARYGPGAEIGRMTLDPVDGLTARDRDS